MRSGGVAWRNPPCTPGRRTRRRYAWWKKRGPTPMSIPRPWPAMDCCCGPPPRLQNSSGGGLPRDNPSVPSRPSFWPGAVMAWMAWASVPCCWCGTRLRGIRARECGNGCGRITARSNSRGVACALSHVGCLVKARGSTLLSPSGSMGNGRWSQRTGCSVLRSWRIGSVPIMGVLMKPILAFPKRLLDHALGNVRHLPRNRGFVRESGSHNGLTSSMASSKPGTPGQGVERAPTAAQNLRHEQRRNLWLAPERVGRLLTDASRGAERP